MIKYLQRQNGRISNFSNENSNDLYLQGRKAYLNQMLKTKLLFFTID